MYCKMQFALDALYLSI